MGWNIGDALPAPPRATPSAGDAVDLRTRPLLEALEPHDALLHASAGMALSAWSAKLGKGRGLRLRWKRRAVRRRAHAWLEIAPVGVADDAAGCVVYPPGSGVAVV